MPSDRYAPRPLVGGLRLCLAGVLQNLQAAPGGDPGDDDADPQVRPGRAQPQHQSARDDDAAVGGEVVETEGRGGAQIDVVAAQPPQQLQTDQVHHRRDDSQDNHGPADRLGPQPPPPAGGDQDADGEDEQQDARRPRRAPLPGQGPAAREEADQIDDAVGGVVQRVGQQGAGVRQQAAETEPGEQQAVEDQDDQQGSPLALMLAIDGHRGSSLFSRMRAARVGSTRSVSSVAVSRPPMTTVASGFWTSAPAPKAKAIGMKPSIATRAAVRGAAPSS